MAGLLVSGIQYFFTLIMLQTPGVQGVDLESLVTSIYISASYELVSQVTTGTMLPFTAPSWSLESLNILTDKHIA